IEPAHINRNLAVAALLGFAGARAATATTSGAWSRIAGPGILGLTMLCAALSRHESSMVALIIGLVVFWFAYLTAKWASRGVLAAWVFACIAVLPLSLAAHRAELHKVPWLHHSLQHRIVIWNTTAEETLKAPLLGIGAYMTYVLMPERNKTAARDEGVEYKRTFSRHAHNVYLQTWFELGAVGALLLMTAGAALLSGIGGLPVAVRPFALATFATAATMMSSSYGMWQTWYLALFALAAVALAVGVRAREGPI
ncbi:MAG: O-antigen ligase family protein, partial [Hyphomicrobium sp.]